MYAIKRDELIRRLRTGFVRWQKTNAATRGYDRKSSTRNGCALSMQGVLGEVAWFGLTGRSSDALDDTAPRSERKGTDTNRDDLIVTPKGHQRKIDIKTTVNVGRAELHVTAEKEHGKVNPENIYVLMAIMGYKNPSDLDNRLLLPIIQDFLSGKPDSDLKVPHEIRVICLGWVDSESLWDITKGVLTNVNAVYGRTEPVMRFVVPQRELYSMEKWPEYLEFIDSK